MSATTAENEPVIAERTIAWYRIPVDRDTMQRLNTKSDLQGWLQTAGFLGLLTLTGTAAWLAQSRLPWPLTVLLIFIHGSFWGFLLNGFHELCHQTVFKTRALNTVFVHVFSILSWNNCYWFTASHNRHHRHTLHTPEDLEVTLPVPSITLRQFIKGGIVYPAGLWAWFLRTVRLSCGRVTGPWETRVLSEMSDAGRRRLFNWSRAILAFHVTIVAVSIYFKLWLLPLLITCAPFIGGWLLFLLNNTQHVGLRDNVPDFRLCARTIHINPFLRFLYWHMNYHIEHHMYAAVPCYNLRKLHLLLKPDLPPTPNGIVATWKQIATILREQSKNPTYQYSPPCPAPRTA